MARTHNADLCDRIKVLEDRIAELERDLEIHRASAPHGGWWQAVPYTVPYTPWIPPYTWRYITTSGTSTYTPDHESITVWNSSSA